MTVTTRSAPIAIQRETGSREEDGSFIGRQAEA